MSTYTAEVSAPRRTGAAQDVRRIAVPGTVMRAAQFGEHPARLIAITRHDSHAHVLDMRPVQAVAARTAAGVLPGVAEAAPGGRAADLAGPEWWCFSSLARAFARHCGEAITVHPDTHRVAGVDRANQDADPADYDGLMLPGGVANPDQLRTPSSRSPRNQSGHAVHNS